MKKSRFVVMCAMALMLFVPAKMWAQDSVRHLEFKGLPLNGKVDDYVKNLTSKGFTVTHRAESGVILEGQFTGKAAEVYVIGTSKTQTVWKVVVYLPKVESWSSIKDSYKYYKSMLTEKYGAPKDSYEFFSKPYYEGDGYEMSALRTGKCHYVTFFSSTGGTVELEISKFKQIKIVYEDSANGNLMESERDTSVIDDI